MFEDRVLTCRDCGQEFVFTAGEQEFYAEKGFEHDPTRCRECRTQHRRQPREKVYHDTVCAECGAPTRVPFIPKNDNPIYCDECYKARKG